MIGKINLAEGQTGREWEREELRKGEVGRKIRMAEFKKDNKTGERKMPVLESSDLMPVVLVGNKLQTYIEF